MTNLIWNLFFLADEEEENGEIEELEEETEEEEGSDVIPLEIKEESVEEEAFILGSVISEVRDGHFSVVFVVPDNAPPGTYKVSARAYDQDRQGNIMNEGVASSSVRIKQVIQVAKLAFNFDSIVPGNEFLFIPLLYDQAENQGDGELEIIVYKPDNSVFMDKILKSSDTYSIFIETNYTPGYWKVEGKIGEIETEKSFFVEELEKISSTLEENTLTIRNIGNVLFDKAVEISIGEISEIKDVRLEVGESRRFRLAAPDGEYKIGVSDGSNSEDLGVTLLTGRVISINEIGGYLSENYWMLILLLVVVVFIIIILVIIRKIKSGGIRVKVPKLVGPKRDAVSKPLSVAGTVGGGVVDRGKKEEVSLISLKIKNFSEIQDSAGSVKDGGLQCIDGVLLEAKSVGAKIYVDKEYRIIIFSPSIVKGENYLLAIRVAKGIGLILNNFNSSSEEKINFGIGVHSGDMAMERKEGKLKFVSLGNTVAIAKRLSEYSENEVLLSEQMHKKTLGKVKVEKKGDFWKVTRIVDREQYEDFVNKFLKRQKEEKR